MKTKNEVSFIEQNIHMFRARDSGHIDLVALYEWMYGDDVLCNAARNYLKDITTLHPVSSRQAAALAIVSARRLAHVEATVLEHRPGIVERVILKLRIW